jgi:hypothetical protein
MINNDNTDSNENNIDESKEKNPDEKSGTVIQGFIKIFDPESGEVLVQGRD